MANLANDYPNDQPQPIDPTRPTAKERAETNRQHHQEMASSLIDNTLRAGHGGHMLGKAGPRKTGHEMPPNDLHLQSGAYIPRGVGSFANGDQGMDDASTQDYGKVDKGD